MAAPRASREGAPSLIDPLLQAKLGAAKPEEPVAALLLLRGDALAALRGEETTALAGDETALLRAVRGAGGLPPGSEVRAFPALGALFVTAPAAVLTRLLADPDLVSATVPDQGP